MKLSFTTLGCPDWPFEKILVEASRMGFGGIEIRGVDGKMRAEEVPRFFPPQVERTKVQFRELGLAVTGFGTSVSFHKEEGYKAALEEGRLAIDVCARMGIPAIRIFGDMITDPVRKDEIIERVAQGTKTLCEYARGKGVTVLFEIHGDFNTLDTVSLLMEHLPDCPEFGVLWDIEHSDRVYGDNWREFYQGIKGVIRHVHIKDHLRVNGDFRLCLVGEGDIPIADIVHTLEADGYTGWYSLEWEKKWHPELPEPDVALPGYLEFMKALQKKQEL